MTATSFAPMVTIVCGACLIFSLALRKKGAVRNRWLALAMVVVLTGCWWMALIKDLAANVFFVQVLAVNAYGLAGLCMLEEHERPTIRYLILGEWVPLSIN